MGCDIYIYAEKRTASGYIATKLDREDEPRIYAAFAFLAGVRNYAGIEPLSESRGLPEDCDDAVRQHLQDVDYYSHSWLTLAELNSVDYNTVVENRRYSAEVAPGYINGGLTAPKGSGVMVSLRHLIGEHYISLFKRLADEGYDRIVFAFDC